MGKTVRDLMHRGLITCPAEIRLGQVARRLAQEGVHALVVADRAGQPMGIISDFDLLTGEWLSATPESLETMRQMTAGELMSTPLHTIEADAPVAEASRRLRAGNVHRLLVIEGGRAVGVISIGDLVANLARPATRRETVADVMSRALVVCRADMPLHAAARAMSERRSRSIVIVSAAGHPLGVVTGWDLLEVCEDDCGDRTVSEVMHPPIIIEPTASLREAIDRMITHHIHRLVVVDPQDASAMPLGVLSTADIFVEMAGPDSVWQAAMA